MVHTDSGNVTEAGQAPERKAARLTRVPGGRRNVVKMLLSDEEREQITARARAAGMSVQRLMVEAALAGDAQTATERRGLVVEFAGARRLVAAISRNLNQLAKTANATGEVPPELWATLDATARVIARLDAARNQLEGGGRR